MMNADSEKRQKTLIRVHLSTSSEAERSVVYGCVTTYEVRPGVLRPMLSENKTFHGTEFTTIFVEKSSLQTTKPCTKMATSLVDPGAFDRIYRTGPKFGRLRVFKRN